jgi:hypothetical protein
MKTREYSGPYFWLATLSFVMPLAVAAWAFTQIPRPFTYAEIQLDASGVDQNLWNHLLQNYVTDGLIDYRGLRRDHHFKSYIAQLAGANPDVLDRDARLAFYCNAYNAFVIDGVIRHKIDTSVLDYKNDEGVGFFDAKEHILAARTLDLNTLEHKIIRPKFDEPRIHMALVCAAKSCPRIRAEAYFGDRIDKQLEDQATLFVNAREYVRFEPSDNTLVLSPILDWYGDDFGGRAGYLEFLRSRCEDPALRESIQRVAEGEGRVAFSEYDWSLNAQDKAAGEGAGGHSPSLGSGTVHNDEM